MLGQDGRSVGRVLNQEHSAAKFNRNLIQNYLIQQEIRTFINRSRACMRVPAYLRSLTVTVAVTTSN